MRTGARSLTSAAPWSSLPERPFLIGVAGGSSSGKTTVAERLAELAGERHLALIKLDSYYVDLGELPLDERTAFDFDHPDAFDWPLLNDHLAALAAGAPVPGPGLRLRRSSTAAARCASSTRRASSSSRASSCSGSRRCGSASTSRCSSTPTPTCG